MLYSRTVPTTVNFLGTNVPEPRAFLDFLGFEKHIIQIRDKRGASVYPGWYDHAAYYVIDLQPEKIFGTGDEVTIPSCVKAGDYEFEIGCYVTEEALLTTKQEALKFFKEKCFLTIVNDWSARDIQRRDMEGLGPTNSKFVIGKSVGPKLIPVKNFEMDDNGVMDLETVLRINGEERSRSNYNSIYHTHPTTGLKHAWSFPRILTFLGQQNISVQPGYLIGSGTIGDGCIAEFSAKIDPQTGAEIAPAKYGWLKDGDVVLMEVAGIGTLENKVRVKEYAPVN